MSALGRFAGPDYPRRIMHVPATVTSVSRPMTRPRLMRRLAGTWKAAVLSAPAGYGKTTLAGQYASRRPVVVCRLHPEDREPAHLLGSLLAAAARLHPPVCPRTERLFVSRRDMEKDGGLLTASFLDELIPPRGKRLVILEDLHSLAGAGESLQWLSRIVDESGPRVRFLLTCRGECPIPLARLDLQGGTVVIRAEELEFTTDEEGRLLRDSFRLRLTATERTAFREAIGGWAAGLTLAAQRMRRTGRTPEVDPSAADELRLGRLLSFLAEEVFSPLPERLRRGLCRVAWLEELDPATVNALLGAREGGYLLREIAQRDLFVQTLPGSASAPRFHRLFRDFLRERWQSDLSERERRLLLVQLAGHWTKRGEASRAVRVLVTAGAVAEATRLFDRKASSDHSPDLSLLPVAVELLHRAGSDPAAASPWVEVHAAMQLRNEGKSEEALLLWRSAQDRFAAQGEFPAVARTFRMEGVTAVMTGRHLDSIRRAQELLRRIPAGEAASRGLIASEVGSLWLQAGETGQSRRALAEAEQLLRNVRLPVELSEVALRRAAIAYVEGRWGEYLQVAQRGLAALRRAGLYTRLQSLLNNMASACVYLGEEDRAVPYLDEADSLRTLSGLPTNQAHLGTTRARALSDQGRFTEAQEVFREVRGLLADYPDPMASLALDVWEGVLERRRGRLADAEKHLANAVAGYSRIDSPPWLAFSRMELALVHGLRKKPEQALPELTSAARMTKHLGDRKEFACNRLYAARVLLGTGGNFRPPLLQSLRILTSEGHLVLMRKEADVAVPLLRAWRESGAEGTMLQRAVAALPEPLRRKVLADTFARPARAAARRDPVVAAPRVEVRLLGRFEVRIGSRLVQFGRRASEALVALLAIRRTASVSREMLAEALWPGAPFEASRNRFDVTLSAARRALEPEAGARGPFRVLITEAGFCRLGRSEEVFTDADDFERRARACEPILDRLSRRSWSGRPVFTPAEARKFREQVAAAVEVYGGDLLPGFLYASWTESERERLRERHYRLLLALGTLALILGRNEEAGAVARRALQDDPFREEAERLLLQAMLAAGERAAALESFRVFRRRMERELGLVPSPETVALVAEGSSP
jgi:ATP/maltotriose-dependent transcriptional regulator MalT/DNA-binding SARP family transcriptional activator